MDVVLFAFHYPNERNRVFKVLESCQNKGQLNVAKNYFTALKNKWSGAVKVNRTVALMVCADEVQFLSDLHDKETLFV
jgi:hypothetical protein